MRRNITGKADLSSSDRQKRALRKGAVRKRAENRARKSEQKSKLMPLLGERSPKVGRIVSWRTEAIIFDGDDTLWMTQPLYETAKDQFEALCREVGVWDPSIRQRVDAVDGERVELLGFSKERFPGSLVQVLDCARTARGLPKSKMLASKALRIGKSVFSTKAPLRAGARATLQHLATRYRLLLVTKGDSSVQLRRLRDSELAKFFGAVYVVKDKTPQMLRDIFRQEKVAASRVLVVGDSLRSDVKPALAIGASAVWIPAPTWHFEHSKRPRSKRFIELESLSGLSTIL
jgi:putative hydrolase of the HAD superfamily